MAGDSATGVDVRGPTIRAFTTANSRFADGVRNMSCAAQLLQQVKLPVEYTDEGVRNPSCNR